MLKIAIATASVYKLNAILKVLYELDIDFKYMNSGVDSEVSEQPNKQGEAKQGSINRAKNILKEFPQADIGLGVEFGYELTFNSYHMVCWASILTSEDRIFSEQSSTLEVPQALREALKENIYIDDILKDFYSKLDNSESQRALKTYIRKRRPIYECTQNVMLRYLMDELY
jgi:non-canonical (house-cleaning) NTP pyrophosphatase